MSQPSTTKQATEVTFTTSLGDLTASVLFRLNVSTAEDRLRFLEGIDLISSRFLASVIVGKQPVAVFVEGLQLVLATLHLLECSLKRIRVLFHDALRIRLCCRLVLDKCGIVDPLLLAVR